MGLFDVFSTGNAEAARDAQVNGLSQAWWQGSDALTKGREALNTNYAAGLLPFQQNYDLSYGQQKAGAGALGDALGINGAEGSARATASFQNSPGYTAAVNAASENVLRNRSRTGDTRSGATNIDLSNVAQNAQNQQWQQYITNLLPYTQMGQQGTQAAASGIGTLDAGLGNQLNSNWGDAANLAYSVFTGIGNANANAELAKNNASANTWGALMQGANMAANLLPFLPSDERIKEDIEAVGELFDGQPIYRYRYIGDPSGATHIGVLAQEAETVNPEAVVDLGGVKAVHYGRATDFAAGLGKYLEAA